MLAKQLHVALGGIPDAPIGVMYKTRRRLTV
jgi:hypothetical protein